MIGTGITSPSKSITFVHSYLYIRSISEYLVTIQDETIGSEVLVFLRFQTRLALTTSEIALFF